MREDSRTPNPPDLSIAEKILRVQNLWDEIAETPDGVEVTEAQLSEAERRLAEYRADPTPLESWEKLRRRLEHER